MNHTASLIHTGTWLLLAAICLNYPFNGVRSLWKEMMSAKGRSDLAHWIAINWKEALRRIASSFCFYSGIFLLMLTLA